MVTDNSGIEGVPERLVFSRENQGALLLDGCSVSCTHVPLIEVLMVKDGEAAARFGDFGEDRGFDHGRKTFHLTWHDEDFSKESSYYVRAAQFDGDTAWSSPIWIRPR